MGRILKEIKSYLNFPVWMGATDLKRAAKRIGLRIKDVFRKPTPRREETFEEALERLHLTEQDLEVRKEVFQRLVYVYFAMGGLLYFYLLYLLWGRHFLASLVLLAILGVVCAYTFRYHFWLFQIKHRRLGCTFNEWLRCAVMGEEL